MAERLHIPQITMPTYRALLLASMALDQAASEAQDVNEWEQARLIVRNLARQAREATGGQPGHDRLIIASDLTG